jgi:uroporphyrinogen-III synthase
MNIWMTRAKPLAIGSAEALRARGHSVVIEPLLSVTFLKPDIDPQAFDAYIFTSQNAVAAFTKAFASQGLCAYCVGDATAKAAQDIGFTKALSAQGDTDDLCRLIVAHVAPEQNLLWVTSKAPASELDLRLKAKGFKVTKAEAYKTEILRPDLDWAQLNAVILYSPKAALALVDLMATQKQALVNPALSFVCISEAVALALRQGLACPDHACQNLSPRLKIAKRPDEASLLAIIDEMAVKKD